jgi:serine/threonine protein kinase/Tfp pilus assembly protein PilF
MVGSTVSHYRILEKLGEGGPGRRSPLPETSMIGSTVSHYRILEKLGEGGMGVVYKAEDLRLKRTVALKVLPSSLTDDLEAKERFMTEAQAASAFQHTNICTIHDIEKTPDGRLFIVMDFYDGETVKEKIRRGPLKPEQAIDIALQIAQGLSSAHEHGIVHRDIKPANVIITSDGMAKIVDFGLAKLAGRAGLTRTGSTMGTAGYMAPEQIQGIGADARADIFSLGVVLFEMLTGHLPFRGAHEAALIYSILNEEPEELRASQIEVPGHVAAVIDKALQKDREQRYQTARAMIQDLKAAGPDAPERRLPLRSTQRSIAVLPFGNLSADPEQEYFCDGLTEEIINTLSHVEGLRVVARTSAFTFKGKQEDVRQIGRKLNVESVLEGNVQKSGNRLRITVQLINIADGYNLWSSKFDKTMEDIFAIQDDISLAIVDNLSVTLLKGEKARLIKRSTEDPEAYNLYLKGRYFFNLRKEEGLRKSVECYLEAVRRDPEFALAYTGLGESYLFLGDWRVLPLHAAYNEARKAATTALRIDDTLAEAHLLSGEIKMFCDWDWAAAQEELTGALAINPACAEAHHMYAHFLELHGRFDDALTEMSRAIDLEPVSPSLHSCVVQVLFYARRYDESIAHCGHAMEMAPHYSGLYGWRGIAYAQKGMIDRGIQDLKHGLERLPSDPRMEALLGHAYAEARKETEVQDCIDHLQLWGEKKYIDPYFMSWIYAAHGNRDVACLWLKKAYDEHSEWLPWLAVDPLLDSLRDDATFQELLKRVRSGI